MRRCPAAPSRRVWATCRNPEGPELTRVMGTEGQEAFDLAPHRLRMRQERRMPRLRHLDETCRRHPGRQFASRRNRCDAIVLAGDDQRRDRDRRELVAQVRVAQDAEPGGEGLRIGLTVRVEVGSQRAQRLRRVLVAPGLQRQEIGNGAAVIAGESRREAIQHAGIHACRPVVARKETRGGCHQHQRGQVARPRAREFQRHHAAQRPPQYRRALRYVRRNGTRQITQCRRALGPRAAAVPGQVDEMQARPSREILDPRSPHATVQGPAVQQHDVRTVAADLDVQRCAHVAAAGVSTPFLLNVCSASSN